jgi:hypothetical protein
MTYSAVNTKSYLAANTKLYYSVVKVRERREQWSSMPYGGVRHP